MSVEKHHNGLTPAEAERLAMLAEEAGEIVQVVGKILRHGYESFHPLQPEVSNRTLLNQEVGDLCVVLRMMLQAGDCKGASSAEIDRRMKKKFAWTHYQGERA